MKASIEAFRWWGVGMAVCTGLMAMPGGVAAQSERSAAGRYQFETASAEGTHFSGVVLVRASAAGGYEGVLFSTLRPPAPLIDARRQGDLVHLAFDLDGPRPVFELQLGDGEFEGRWLLAGRTGRMSGSYKAGPHVDVEPTPCVLEGVEELARCGVFHLPEDVASPDGRWIPINVAILPSTGTTESKGALFHFAGGPGQAATEQAGTNAVRFERIRESRDVVMVDQRGTGGSYPLRCPAQTPQATARTILAWDLSPDWVAQCAADLRSRADLRLYTTRHAVEDVESVRRWLGYGAIDLYGGSYGTRAALEYARRYPDAVRTSTLRGVMPPGASMSIGNALQVDIELERVFTQCEADPDCDAAYPDLRDRYADLLERLKRDPVVVTTTDPGTGDTVGVEIDRSALGGALRRLLMNAETRLLVPRAIASAYSGDFDFLAPGIRGTLSVTSSMYFGMAFSVSCAEEVPFTAARDWRAETAGTLLGARPANALATACGAWDAGTPDPVGTKPVDLNSPALFLSGEYDPVTPVSWAEKASATAPNGRHVVFRGGSHAPFPDCGLELMAEMVERGTTRELDVSCAAEQPDLQFVMP